MSDSEKETKVSSAQLRKIKKPLIERRRRERINESLNQLKALVLDALHKDESRFSKMEKADILEMTVKHLKSVQHRQQSPSGASAVINRYTAGFQECAQEVHRYLSCTANLSPEVRTRLMSHLNSIAQKAPTPAAATASSPANIQPAPTAATAVQIQVPSATQAMTLPGLNIVTSQGVVPVLSATNAHNAAAIPISVNANGIVTILPPNAGDMNTKTVFTTGANALNHNVIPLYVNTTAVPQQHQLPTSVSSSQYSSNDSSPFNSPGSSASSTVSSPTQKQPAHTASSNQPNQTATHTATSPKAGDEAPAISSNKLNIQQSATFVATTSPTLSQQQQALSQRANTVISHTQTVLHANFFSQDCRTALQQQQSLPAISGQGHAFYQAQILNSKVDPVWRPW